MRARPQAATVLVTEVGAALSSQDRAKAICARNVAWQPVDLQIRQAIDRTVALSVLAAALPTAESTQATMMTSLQGDFDGPPNRRRIQNSKKSFGKSIKTTSATPKAGDASDERS
jgi:hypothetical protein